MSAVALYSGLMVLLFVALSVNVSRLRGPAKRSYGADEGTPLYMAMRAHGNLAETLPIALIVLFLLAATGYAAWLIHVFGIVLVVARLAHAHGLISDVNGNALTPTRMVGAGLTQLYLVLGGLLVLIGAF